MTALLFPLGMIAGAALVLLTQAVAGRKRGTVTIERTQAGPGELAAMAVTVNGKERARFGIRSSEIRANGRRISWDEFMQPAGFKTELPPRSDESILRDLGIEPGGGR